MSLYLIGDLQGCDQPFERLLDKIAFSPSRDQLVLLGDIVNRGPASLALLRRLLQLGNAAESLLGNHDLHLLAVAHGVRKAHRNDTLNEVLQAPDRPELLDWLRQRPLALYRHGWLLVHAGVLPQWTVAQALELAEEVSTGLRSSDGVHWLHQMYGNQPDHWREDWPTAERWRVVVNALTRLRFCSRKGVMEFESKDHATTAPEGYMPWFDVTGRRSAGSPIAFGHWSTLGLMQRHDLLALDTGCVWGGCLSAARLLPDGSVAEVIQVPCAQAQRPAI